MSTSDMRANRAQIDAEIELSTEDLAALSGADAVNTITARSSTHVSEPPVKLLTDTKIDGTPPKGSRGEIDTTDRRRTVARAAASVGLIAVTFATVRALYGLSTPGDVVGYSSTPAFPAPTEQSEAPESAAEPEPQGQPVRFANPFDATEVFEFPAGTSEAEAHEAVRNMLVERARQRQGLLVRR